MAANPKTSTSTEIRELEPAPGSVIDPAGRPRFGAFRGSPDAIDFSGLAKPYARGAASTFMRRKKWMYVFASTDELMVAAAVVDAGPTATAFVMAVDRRSGAVIADASRPGAVRPLVGVNEHPGDGHANHYAGPGTLVSTFGSAGKLRLRATIHRIPSIPVLSGPWIELDVTLGPADHDALTVVSDLRLDPPLVSTTVKNGALATTGTLAVRERGGVSRWSLDGGLGGYDYTNGYLPRHTSWNWAFGTGRATDGRIVAVNLVADFTGQERRGAENCIWVDGQLILLDPDAAIGPSGDAERSPWSIRTADGAVDLSFTPDAVHHESLNLGLLRSKFVQALGGFRGTIRLGSEVLELADLAGVVEDQDVLW